MTYTSRSTGRADQMQKLQLSREDSSVVQLVDLHVYKVPGSLWRDSFNNILNNVVTETVSIGIIRVPSELRLVDIREEIVQQLQVDDLVPRDYVFLRSVGRSLTRLRGKQEYQLKAKHFLPPVAYAPELYVLEATSEIRDALAISERSSQSPPLSRRTSPSHTHRGYPSSYRNGYPGDSDTERSAKAPHQPASPGNKYQSLPQIGNSTYRVHPDLTRDPPNPSDPSSNYHAQNYHDSSSNKYTDPFSQQNNPHLYNKHNDNNNNNSHNNYNDSNMAHEEFHKPPLLQDYLERPSTQREEQPETKPVALATAQPPGHELSRRVRSPHHINPSPPRSAADKGRDRRHDDDSGVAGLSPENDYHRRIREEEYDNMLRKTRDMQRQLGSERFDLDDETESERRRRLDELESRNNVEKQRWEAEQEERRRQAENDRRKQEDERKRQEEQEKREREKEIENRRKREENERHRRDEEERRRRDEEENKRLREERQRQEEEDKKRNQYNKEDSNRFGSSPPFQLSSPEPERDTESARQQRRDERNQLLKDLEEARIARQNQEKEREDLVKKAKTMQHKTTNRRNEARDTWKKKYFEEKKKTAPLEETSGRLRQELEALHRRLMNTLEGPKERNLQLADNKPSSKNNYVIQCTKLQHEIEDLQRRVENARMKLTAEMKLRNQAQGELRALRAELMQKKTSLDNTRQQHLIAFSMQSKGRQAEKENHPPHIATASADTSLSRVW